MKSYGKPDPSWDKTKLRSILEDALHTADEHFMSLFLCESEDGHLYLSKPLDNEPIFNFVCGITPPDVRDYQDLLDDKELKEVQEEAFWDNVEGRHYTIDEMVSRAYDFLVNGIIEFGELNSDSDGELQLKQVWTDAEKQMAKHNIPFIFGLRKQGDIALCPVSEKSQFYTPLSCMITKSGLWSVSDMHQCRISLLTASCISATLDVDIIDKLDGGDDPRFILYDGIVHNRKSYGMPDDSSNKHLSIMILENALEDAIRMPDREQYRIVMHRELITIKHDKEKTDHELIEVNREEFLDGDALLHEKVSATARDMYEKYCQILMSENYDKPEKYR